MTRTQKLGLCTWLPDDPVCLAEVNDNFTRLDANGGRSLTLAESAMVHLGGLMAAQAHQGGHAAYADRIMADAFQDAAQLSSYDGVYYHSKRLELLAAGLSSGTVYGPNSTPGAGGAYSASNVQRLVNVTQSWSKLFDFQPEAYGQLTKLNFKTLDSGSTASAIQAKLSIWDEQTNQMLLETELGSILRTSKGVESVDYTVNCRLDPNRKYVMKLWVAAMPYSAVELLSVTFTVTPLAFSSGSVTMQAMAVPAGATQAELLLHGSATAAQVSIKFDSGEYTALAANASAADTLPGGESCVLRRYTVDVPEGTQSAQLKLSLSGTDCKVYDFALVLL